MTTTRIFIERLVVHDGVLAPKDRDAFEAALTTELSRLRAPHGQRLEPPSGAVNILARHVATALQSRLPSP